ncbi:MAG: MGMT family protein [Deltaproteobacteria bacterium]|nr:MGMT family protein [Deltaproteobacteria bacterium]
MPYGEGWTYGQIAKNISKIGSNPNACRAVGQNSLILVSPCHRVVGAGGNW